MSEQVTCQQCGAVIGKTVEVEGVELLEVGGARCREVRGFCVRCGKVFHWSISDKMLEKLVRSVQKNEGDLNGR